MISAARWCALWCAAKAIAISSPSRDGDMLVLQLVAPQVGLAGMVTTVLGSAEPANVEPLTGVASEVGGVHIRGSAGPARRPAGHRPVSTRDRQQPDQLGGNRRDPTPPRRHDHAYQGGRRCSRLNARQAGVAAPPSRRRVVRKFPSGTQLNLQRALDSLLELLPAGSWLDHAQSPQITPKPPPNTDY